MNSVDPQTLERIRNLERRVEDLEREVQRLRQLAALVMQSGREVSARAS